MLGCTIADPLGIEGPPGTVAGLGLLDVETVLGPDKALRPVRGIALGARFDGYEMHMGETAGTATNGPFAMLDDGRPDGAVAADGRVMGTYCHGLLASGELRRTLLAGIGAASHGGEHHALVDAALDELAAGLEAHLDIDALLALGSEARR